MSEITAKSKKADIFEAYTALLEKVGTVEESAANPVAAAAVAYVEARERVVTYNHKVEADRCYVILRDTVAKH